MRKKPAPFNAASDLEAFSQASLQPCSGTFNQGRAWGSVPQLHQLNSDFVLPDIWRYHGQGSLQRREGAIHRNHPSQKQLGMAIECHSMTWNRFNTCAVQKVLHSAIRSHWHVLPQIVRSKLASVRLQRSLAASLWIRGPSRETGDTAIMISVETLKWDDYSSATPSTLEKHYPRGLKRSEGGKKSRWLTR